MKYSIRKNVKRIAAGVLAVLLVIQSPVFVSAGDGFGILPEKTMLTGGSFIDWNDCTPSDCSTPSVASLYKTTRGITRDQAVAWVTQLGDSHWSVDVNQDGTIMCSDLIMAYMDYLLGWHYDLDGDQYRIPWYCPAGWQQIRARADFMAQPGDIAIWTGGDCGHAGIVLEGYSGGFVLCDIDGWETEAGQHDGYADYGHRNFNADTTYTFWGVLRPDWPATSFTGTLDLSGLLDGSNSSSLGTYGTADVYVDGILMADDVSEFHFRFADGTDYEICDIKAADGHVYNGLAAGSASLTGTVVKNQTKNVRLSYSSIHTVNFVSAHGTVPASQSVKNGEQATCPAALSETGYTFGGWYSDSGFKNAWDFTNGRVTKDTTLYAKWTAIKYQVSFNTGGIGKAVANQSVAYGNTARDPGTPSAAGYTFGGWYADSKFTTKWDFANKKITKAVTVYGKWTANNYTIKYNGNGATSGSMKALTGRTYGKSYKLTANAFKKSGYVFTGWNTVKGGTGTAYADKASVKNLTGVSGGTVTLYAQWTKKYSITYVLDGGKNSSGNPSGYTKLEKITLSKPTKAGYTFEGWYTDSKYKNKITAISKGSTGNKKLYARWTRITYTVKFSGNGATSGKMTAMSNCKGASSYKLTANQYKRTGYTFTGWNTKNDGSGSGYRNKAAVKNLTAKNKATVTLYAQWKANKYTICFSANGGTGKMSSVSATYDKAVKLQACTMKKNGKVFDSWNTKADGSGKAIADSSSIKSLTGVDGSTVTLYAQWKTK